MLAKAAAALLLPLFGLHILIDWYRPVYPPPKIEEVSHSDSGLVRKPLESSLSSIVVGRGGFKARIYQNLMEKERRCWLVSLRTLLCLS